MKITFPSNTNKVIDSIRQAIGRPITIIYQVGVSGCSVCSLDPITNESTDPFCPVCSGHYWIPIYSGHTTIAHVFWKSGEQLDWLPGGQLYDADVTIQIGYSGNIEQILNSAKYYEVDGRKFEEEKRIYRGVPSINRVIVFLREMEKEE